MTALIPFLAVILGALSYALSSNPKVAELGRIVFAAGAFWLVAIYAHAVVHLP